jgi:hypothetical protein
MPRHPSLLEGTALTARGVPIMAFKDDGLVSLTGKACWWCVDGGDYYSKLQPPGRYVHLHHHFLVDYFLKFGRILPSTRQSSRRLSRGTSVGAVLKS